MRTRTSNLLIRSQVLYPIELWARHARCPGQDSNLHAISGTGPSNQPVYQFQHLGIFSTFGRHCATPLHTRSALRSAAQAMTVSLFIGRHCAKPIQTRSGLETAAPTAHRVTITDARRGTRTLTRLLPQDPESCASANSAIRATPTLFLRVPRSQPFRADLERPHGAEGNRTPDLLNAIQALYQLSYSPSIQPEL
jgi:hypothetical protein